jgi:tetratricopeptide (TPR) repeat protein
MSSDQQISVPSLTAVQVELFWAQHGKKVLIGSALVLLILIGIGAYLGYQAVRNSKAAEAFAGAHDVKGWESVIQRYSGTIAAGNAYLQIAGTQAANGQYGESDKSYQTFIKDYSGHPLFVNALFGLASNAEAEGKTDEALKYYSDISSSNRYGSDYLAPMALYYQGRMTEKTGKQKEALQDFEEVLQRYPQSAMAVWARRDADRLTAKLGLNVKAAPSPSATSASATGTPQASPSASATEQGSPSPQVSPSAQSSASPESTTSATPQPTATPRSTLEP